MGNRTPIEALLDGVEWEVIERDTVPDGLYSTHEGVLTLGDGIRLRVSRLNNGQRVIDARDVEAYFGVGQKVSDNG